MTDLPKDLEIPPPFIGDQADYTGWRPALVQVEDRYPIIETERGRHLIHSFDDVIDALYTKHLFTVTEQGHFDSLLRWLPRQWIFALDLGLDCEISGWTITYRGSSIVIQKGKVRRYLINLWKFFKLDDVPIELATVDALISMLFEHMERGKIEYSNLSSPASVSRHMMLLGGYREFLHKPVDYDTLNDIYQACHGGRSESVGIGSTLVHNYDMKNAHLNILAHQESIMGTQYREDWPYIPEARFGIYLISTKIPQMPMCPLPVEISDSFRVEVVYPYGEVSGWYAKPYLDLLTKLKIPFKVLKSYQFVPVKDYPLPFARVMRTLRKFQKTAPEYINAKAFYYGMAGSTISWRWEVKDEDTGELVPKAFNVFNPLIYAHVLASQTVKVFQEAHRAKPIAIRSDAVTVDKSIWTPLKLEDNGMMVFVNPLFKVFPSGRGSEWLDYIWEYRDEPYFEYEVEEYPPLAKFLRSGAPLGKRHSSLFTVRPHHGKRVGLRLKKVGRVLDGWIPSKSPSINVLRKYM